MTTFGTPFWGGRRRHPGSRGFGFNGHGWNDEDQMWDCNGSHNGPVWVGDRDEVSGMTVADCWAIGCDHVPATELPPRHWWSRARQELQLCCECVKWLHERWREDREGADRALLEMKEAFAQHIPHRDMSTSSAADYFQDIWEYRSIEGVGGKLDELLILTECGDKQYEEARRVIAIFNKYESRRSVRRVVA
jgi:hypothetical protein